MRAHYLACFTEEVLLWEHKSGKNELSYSVHVSEVNIEYVEDKNLCQCSSLSTIMIIPKDEE